MRIEFDSGSPRELTAAAALIAVLRAGNDYRTAATAAHQAVLAMAESGDLPGQSDIVRPAAPAPAPSPTPAAPPPPPATDAPDPAAAFPPNDAPDAAAAFGGGGAGDASSAPIPPVPTAPPAPSGTAGVETDAEGLPWDKRIHSDPAKKNADGKWRAKRNLDDAVRADVVAQLRQVMAAPGPLSATGGAPVPPAPDATAPTAAPPAPVPTPPAADTASGPVGATTAVSPPPPPPAAPALSGLAAAVADGWTPHPTAPGFHYKGQESVADDAVAAMYPASAPTPPAPPVPPAPLAAPAAGAPVVTFADLMRKITGLQTAGLLTVEQTAAISTGLGITGVRDLMQRPDLIPSFDAALPVAA